MPLLGKFLMGKPRKVLKANNLPSQINLGDGILIGEKKILDGTFGDPLKVWFPRKRGINFTIGLKGPRNGMPQK